MKNKTIRLITGLLLLSGVFAFGQQKAPFSRGVAFANWFECVNSAQEISFRRFTEQDFADVKKLGADVIRLPIDFNVFTSSAPNYTIDPFLFKLLDQVVDLAEKYQIYIILDNHPRDMPPTNVNVRNFLIPVWTQVAQRYKNRSQYVVYEIHNEVNHITSANWGKIQGEAIDAIRKVDTQHWIVVTGVDNTIDGNSAVGTLESLPKYTDNKLIYTFHFYFPFMFTFQGGNDGGQEIKQLAWIPFPYDKNRMPAMPNQIKGTWVENEFKNYPKNGTAEAVIKRIDIAANFSKQRKVPVFCGEFGVYKKNIQPEDRVRYNKLLREAFEARNIAWTMWGVYEDKGLFNGPSWGDINIDLNVELVQALGFTPVPQKQREPLQSGFTIYDDYPGRGFRLRFKSPDDDFYSKVNLFYTPAAEGAYAIQWKDIPKNGDLAFDIGINDFTYLVQNGFFLEFKVKSESTASLNIIFGNLQDNMYWENSISNVKIQPDGKWQTVRIPLNTIKECYGGLEDGTWKWIEAKDRPVSWNNILMMKFQSTQDSGRELYLDDIKITK